jgi:hypothetical protein
MNTNYRRMVVALLLACGLAAACQKSPGDATTEEVRPIKIEHLEGNDPTREILTEEAAKRLDIQTAKVTNAEVNGVQSTVIPYAAIVYDTQGNTWVYLNPEPFIYVRRAVGVKDIVGDQAILSDAPPVGSAVVTVGVAELYGAEFEFQEE